MNMQKKSVIRAEYKAEAVVQSLGTARARAAYHWLVANNPTYAWYTQEHLRVLAARQLYPDTPLYIGTSQLLLFSPGIEVAARPVLYARSAFGDSDHRARLVPLGRMDVRGVRVPGYPIATSSLVGYWTTAWISSWLVFCMTSHWVVSSWP